jgi:protein-disulfide isomerase
MRNLFVLLILALLPMSAGGETLATAGKKTISREEVEKEMRAQLGELEEQRYAIIRSGIDQLVAQALMEQEAEARKITIEELQKVEIIDKAGTPSDAEMKKLYDDNVSQMGGQSFDQVKDQVVNYLVRQRAEERARIYIGELKKKYPTKIALRPKTVQVELGSRPPLGSDKAPITIVEFSDYECPFRKRAEPVIKEVLKVYGDKVRVAYRDYPLPFHANARPASEAAHCAAEQGKFWQYHDKLMAASDLSADGLKAIAKTAELDQGKFDECVAAERFEAAINKDIAAGEAAGVQGTPAFFINGRMLDGAQPLEKFREIIDEELEYAGAAS